MAHEHNEDGSCSFDAGGDGNKKPKLFSAVPKPVKPGANPTFTPPEKVEITAQQEDRIVNKVTKKVHDLIEDHEGHDHGHSHGEKKKLDVQAFNLSGIQKRWTENTTGGKFGMALGSTASLGVILHGGLNIKRGLMGYDDTQTGQHKKGSLENLIFGAGETYVGAAMLRRFLTGNTSWALWK